MNNNYIESEKYLTIDEVAELSKYKKQTLYNKIYKREFIDGKHYKKLSRKKLLFIQTGIREWLGENADDTIKADYEIDIIGILCGQKRKNSKCNNATEKCRIKI
jgi:predicted DNA-binding transcriptional regulator AlpA